MYIMLFLHFCKPLLTDSAKPSFYIPCKNLIFTYRAKTSFSYPAKTSFYMTCNTYFLCFCKPHFTYSAIPSFLHILQKPPFMFLTTDAAEIYLSCKHERHPFFSQYVNFKRWPKLSAVHQNPIWVELGQG